MILFIVKLFTNLIYNAVYSEMYLIFFCKINRKNENTYNILLYLEVFCFSTVCRN